MRNLMGKKSILVILVVVMISASMLYSHCQIPCGIYGDQNRFDMLVEHITTIEKSMKKITELSQQENQNLNQVVRWVDNKEKHADQLSHILTYYFLAQRIKPLDKAKGNAYDQYIKKLTLLHQMLVYSMKAKQTTDLSDIDKLRALLAEFRTVYFDKHKNEY